MAKPAAKPKRGTLYLIVGPSGAGKDTLLAGARRALARDKRYFFPQRLITRPSDAGGEVHVAVSRSRFDTLRSEGAFALAWEAHGHAYGIPVQIDGALARGIHVAVNVSRTICGEALQRFAPATIVHVTAPKSLLATRLRMRGREDADAVAARALRAKSHALDGIPREEIRNDGSVDDGVNALLTAMGALVERPAAVGDRP